MSITIKERKLREKALAILVCAIEKVRAGWTQGEEARSSKVANPDSWTPTAIKHSKHIQQQKKNTLHLINVTPILKT